jgi:glycosyltransferase involved in cell wall biosynthesis
MRIGIDATPIINRSGTGYYTQKLIEFLGRADSENEYIIFFPRDYEAHLEHSGMFEYPNFREIKLPAQGQVSLSIWKQMILPRQVRRLGIELFHFPAFIASLRIEVPFVVTVHDLCFWLFPDAFSRLRQLYYKRIIPRSVRTCDCVIADSESTRKDLLSYLAPVEARVQTIHLGVDPVRFYNITDRAAHGRLREKYNVPEEFILYVGTLEPRKNIVRLVKAFKQGVVDRGSPHHLVVAGRKGWLYDDIFREVKSLNLHGRVHFLGHIEHRDLAGLYSMARVLAYPSLYEGFGLPCLEAMSCGTPVIASERSSLPELVADCALLIDPMSIDSIADALARICADAKSHQQLSERGLQRARKFSWLTTARKTVEVYNRTIEESR